MHDPLPQALHEHGFLKTVLDDHPALELERPRRWRQPWGHLEWLAPGVMAVLPDAASLAIDVILSAGIHGDETAPIELLDQLTTALLTDHWRPACRLLLILGNPPAMRQWRRYCQDNLNRLFRDPGPPDCAPGSLGLATTMGACATEQDRAQQLMRCVREFLATSRSVWHLDLHTAIRGSLIERFAICPLNATHERPLALLAWLKAADIQAAVLQGKRSSTFSGWTRHRFGAESGTLELGRVAPFGQNDLGRLQRLSRQLQNLIASSAEPTESGTPATSSAASSSMLESSALPLLFEVEHEIIHSGPGFVLDAADDVPNFTRYEPGQRVWHDPTGTFHVQDTPLFLLFPNTQVAPGQRAGLLVRQIS